MKNNNFLLKHHILFLIIIIFLSFSTLFSYSNLVVSFLDVGQGDAILIETPNGNTILIDGGARGAGKKIIGLLKKKYIKKIDWLILTHPHADHLYGLVNVIKKYNVKYVLDSGFKHSSRLYKRFLNDVLEKKSQGTLKKYSIPRTGEMLNWDNSLSVQVLAPKKKYRGTRSDVNNSSIVIRIVYKRISFLLTGDIEAESEYDISKTTNIRSTVLKAPHHGGNHSSTMNFLRAVKPKYIVVSVGEGNRYGHPGQKALKRYKQINAKVFRTDIEGDIIFTTNGSKLNIQTGKNKTIKYDVKKNIDIIPENNKVDVLKYNINKLSADELVKIPGVNAITAIQIINFRRKKGYFKKISDIKKVPGMNKKIYLALKKKVVVGLSRSTSKKVSNPVAKSFLDMANNFYNNRSYMTAKKFYKKIVIKYPNSKEAEIAKKKLLSLQ